MFSDDLVVTLAVIGVCFFTLITAFTITDYLVARQERRRLEQLDKEFQGKLNEKEKTDTL